MKGQHVRRALGSSAWLLGERAVTLAVNFAVGVLLARYLGPSDFGVLSYALAFVALLATIPFLGFGGVVVQQLVHEPKSHNQILGAVIYTKLAAAVFAFVLGNAIAMFVVPEASQRLLIFLISFSLLFDVVLGLRLHFEAKTEARSVVLVASGSNLFGALARLTAVLFAAPLWVFGALVAVQSLVAAIAYALVYRANVPRPRHLYWDRGRALDLLRQSWPLIISSAGATIYLKIDQFMLGQMRGMEEVGIYAVAARLSEVWYVIPTAVATSVFPRLLELRRTDPAKYEARIREGLRYLFWLSLLVAVPVSLAAPTLVTAIYGEKYHAAGTILAIHVWACPAVYMGMLIQRWFLAEGLLKYVIPRQLLSAVLNVALNWILIPKYGGVGSAVATVVSYTFANYFSCFLSRKMSRAGAWMTEAMVSPLLFLSAAQRTSRAP